MEDGPQPIGPAVDEVICRLMPGIMDRYQEYRRELADALSDVGLRYSRCVCEMRGRRAKTVEFIALAEEKLGLEEYHRVRFRRRVRALVEELLDERAGGDAD